MGKLFPEVSGQVVTVFAPQGGVSSLGSSTFAPDLKDKFVMVVAPGYAHSHATKFVPHDARLRLRSGTSARHCACAPLPNSAHGLRSLSFKNAFYCRAVMCHSKRQTRDNQLIIILIISILNKRAINLTCQMNEDDKRLDLQVRMTQFH